MLFEIHLLVSFINILILLLLFIIFLRNYKSIKSRFTLGLLLFAGIMGLSALFSCPLFFKITSATVNCPNEVYHTSASLFEFFGLLIFLYVVYR